MLVEHLEGGHLLRAVVLTADRPEPVRAAERRDPGLGRHAGAREEGNLLAPAQDLRGAALMGLASPPGCLARSCKLYKARSRLYRSQNLQVL